MVQFILIELLFEIILTSRLMNDMIHTIYAVFAEGEVISVLSFTVYEMVITNHRPDFK